jgi:hypothetical protein
MTSNPSKVPMPANAEADSMESAANILDQRMRGIEGGVRVEIVKRMRAMVDKDPEAFVRGMRGFLHQDRSD